MDTLVLSFDFPVNRSFLEQSDHPITFRKRSHAELVGAVGALDHSSTPVEIITADGLRSTGRVRHSTTRGKTYYQLNSGDPAVVNGLTMAHTLRVELRLSRHGPIVHLIAI